MQAIKLRELHLGWSDASGFVPARLATAAGTCTGLTCLQIGCLRTFRQISGLTQLQQLKLSLGVDHPRRGHGTQQTYNLSVWSLTMLVGDIPAG